MSSFKISKPLHDSNRLHEESKWKPKISRCRVDGTIVNESHRKRVWKACERCKIKKVRCDTGLPCKRCKQDGVVCVPGSQGRKKLTPLPRGYAELLENTQVTLVATVQKLYSMLRNGELWELDEPEINDDGVPVIHDIARLLNCIGEPRDVFLAWPEDADGILGLKAKAYLANRDQDCAEQEWSALFEISDCDESSTQSRESGIASTSLQAAMTGTLAQQEEEPQPQKPAASRHRQLQRKPEVILADGVDLQSPDSIEIPLDPLCLTTESSHLQSSDVESAVTSLSNTADFLSSIPYPSLQAVDWIWWSDILS